MANKRIIIGMSGADGAVLGVRLLSILRDLPDVETFLVMSESAKKNAAMECGIGADEIAGMADRRLMWTTSRRPYPAGRFTPTV